MTNHHPLLLDVGAAPCGCVDHALEELHKALGDPPASADTLIWEPHHDPLLAGPIEDVTARGLAILAAAQAMLVPPLAKADPWGRPDAAELADIAARLAAKPYEDYTAQDWLDLVDLTLGRHLPDSVAQTEGDYLAVRAVFAGRIQAAMAHPLAAGTAMAIMSAAPVTLVAAAKAAQWSSRTGAVLEFARARAADAITNIRDAARARVRGLILDHHERKAQGDPKATLWDLQSKMQDEFATQNRDWRRVAITETGRAANEGFIASLEPGSRVKRVEVYTGACPFCARINGMILTVVPADKPDKDGWAEVWPGKSNVGRSASPRKRVGNELIERLPSELWWPAAGVQHPHCRGRWVLAPSDTPPPGVDPKFHAWLQERLATLGD